MMDGAESSPWTPIPVTEGEWVGWSSYGTDPFEVVTGPFYSRVDEAGRRVCAFRAEAQHMNGGGFMHGGCLMTFADYALFWIGAEAIDGAGAVTAQLSCEFIDSAVAGDLVEATGEVVRAGKSLVFLRGMITTAGRPLLAFSSILKRTRRP